MAAAPTCTPARPPLRSAPPAEGGMEPEYKDGDRNASLLCFGVRSPRVAQLSMPASVEPPEPNPSTRSLGKEALPLTSTGTGVALPVASNGTGEALSGLESGGGVLGPSRAADAGIRGGNVVRCACLSVGTFPVVTARGPMPLMGVRPVDLTGEGG